MWILAARFKSSATVQRARLRPPKRNYSTQTEDSEGIGTAARERVRGTEEERERRKKRRDECIWNVGGPVGVNNIAARR